MNSTGIPPKSETVQLLVKRDSKSSTQILAGEIKGVATHFVTVPTGVSFKAPSAISQQTIYFIVEGSGSFATNAESKAVSRRTLFVPEPGVTAEFAAAQDSCLLQICMDIHPEESGALHHAPFPIVTLYENCEHYRDYFKSEKTVSRTLIHPFTLARFSMGSVETTGPDRIEPHSHRMLDQLFFSFAENNCDLVIDGESFQFGGNCLLHIPLGSAHGIDAKPGDKVHYLWIDFFEKSEDMQYLVDTHKPVGT